MKVYTIQLAKHRLATEQKITVIDTTVKSGVSPFAPTWQMVMDYKSGKITEDEYTSLYIGKMNQLLKDNPLVWSSLSNLNEPVAIACMCKPDTFCHRHLLVKMFDKYCSKRNIDFEYLGEIK